MLTGYPGSAGVSHGLHREIEWMISKPWSDDSLKETLRQLVHAKRSASPAKFVSDPLHTIAKSVARKIAPPRPARSPARRAEEDFRELNLILENVFEGISRLDRQGRFLSINKAFGDLLGYGPEELLGHDWREAIHPDDRIRASAAHARMTDSGKAEIEARGLRKDGSPLPIQLLLIRALDQEGAAVGHFGFMKDVSARKQAEQERDQMSSQLLQGQKLQAIGQLAAGIAHEINNPVGFILSNLTTLLEYSRGLSRLLRAALSLAEQAGAGKDCLLELAEFNRIRREIDAEFIAGDLEPALEQSRQGAERIRDIVKNLKEFTHADVGDVKAVDLASCLEGALRLCWNEIKYKATVQKDYAGIPPVRGVPLRLEQVFMNLFVNAAQAIEKKGEIRISIRREGEQAVVRVRDTGCGIPPENLKRLFEPFFTTKPVGKGTGLGLHVAYKIIQAHQGRIDVASEPGTGTEFTVRLPLAELGAGGA
jgi:PAS domain S-box-containing protein